MSWIDSYGARPTGCKPRKSNPGDICAMADAHLDVVYARKDWDDLLDDVGGEVDFSDCIKQTIDQNGFGSCAHASLNQGGIAACRLAGMETPEFNHWWSYGIAVHWQGGPYVGTNIDSNLEQTMRIGLCPDELWPMSKGPNVRPPEETYAEALRYRIIEASDCINVEQLWSSIYKRRPAVIGWNGHSELLVGLRKGGIVKVWGSYGDTYYNGKPYHYEDIDRVEFKYGAFAIRAMLDRTV